MARKRRSRFFLTLLILFVIYIGIQKVPDLIKILYPYNYEKSIMKYSTEYELKPNLVAAVIKAESNFYVYAKSQKNAIGLMQITPATGEWIAQKLGVEKFEEEILYNPDTNIRFGCWYIDYLSKHYDDNFKFVFSAYNGGEGNVDKWIEKSIITAENSRLDDIPYEETRNYVKKIFTNYKIYNVLYKTKK